MRLTPFEVFDKLRRRPPLTRYLGAITFITGVAAWALVQSHLHVGTAPWMIWLLAIPALV
jgi:hypothetical protein